MATTQAPAARSASIHPMLWPAIIMMCAAIIGLICGGITWLTMGYVNSEKYDVHVSEYMLDMGFDVNQPHPLQLGSPIAGSSGEMNGTASFFLLSGDGSIEGSSRPASSVRLGLSIGDRHYIVEVPYEKVQFNPSTSQPAAAKFNINDVALGQRRRFVEWHGPYPGAHTFPKIQSTAKNADNWERVQKKGLTALLINHLDSVVITLSPADYSKFLNG